MKKHMGDNSAVQMNNKCLLHLLIKNSVKNGNIEKYFYYLK